MAARLLQRQINLLKQRWSGEVNMLKHRSTSEINWLNRRCCSSSSSPPSDSGTMTGSLEADNLKSMQSDAISVAVSRLFSLKLPEVLSSHVFKAELLAATKLSESEFHKFQVDIKSMEETLFSKLDKQQQLMTCDWLKATAAQDAFSKKVLAKLHSKQAASIIELTNVLHSETAAIKGRLNEDVADRKYRYQCLNTMVEKARIEVVCYLLGALFTVVAMPAVLLHLKT
ncbi:hypothetical protein QVD17_41273 [Tagetes erecta]|uniref:Uncharacterized protein n=1 Tax=Tagetes erecta TaxID=13708 RepID=A0AAD8JSV0_TARER|nr:hypothetical protein QVD17_41273 [Tagetes erecta]